MWVGTRFLGAGLGAVPSAGHRVGHLLVDMALALVGMGVPPAQTLSCSVQTSLFGDQFSWLALKEKSSSFANWVYNHSIPLILCLCLRDGLCAASHLMSV